jgi:hypothetical protein
MRYIKLITLTLGLVLLSGLVFVGAANAQSFKSGDTISIPASETIDGMLFAGGNNIDIAGTVNGDVYCGGQTITISGTINGDVFCAGQTINISGKIDGSVRLGGQSITLSGSVGNSATIGAQDLVIAKGASIARDLLGGSQNVTINGTIERDVVSGAKTLTVNGKIGRNISGGLSTLTIGSAGLVGGKVDYIGTKDPTVLGSGKILGQVTRTAPKKDAAMENAAAAFAVGWFVYVLLATLALALVLAALFPRVFEKSAAETIKSPGRTILVGVLGMILTPVLVVTLFITVIGVPIAILTILTWLIIAILCAPFTGYLLGRMIMKDPKHNTVLIMLVGASILMLTYFIPFIGVITMLAAYVLGTGMILMQSRKLLFRPAVVVTKK